MDREDGRVGQWVVDVGRMGLGADKEIKEKEKKKKWKKTGAV